MKNKNKFIDIGSKSGSSFVIANKLGYKNTEGIGIDLNPRSKNPDIEVIYGNALSVPFTDKYFETSISYHLLEHLANMDEVRLSICEMIRVSKKIIWISLPVFDHNEQLADIGYTTTYSTWKTHRCLVHSLDIVEFLMEGNFGFNSISIEYVKKLTKESTEIIPLTDKKDVLYYTKELGEKKVDLPTIFREVIIIAKF